MFSRRDLDAIRVRAFDEKRRTDRAPTFTRALPSRVSETRLSKLESGLGVRLFDEHRQLYLEVADGGFGPGCGLMSIDADDACDGLEYNFTMLNLLPGHTLIPVVDWGGNSWSCISMECREIITLVDSIFYQVHLGFAEFFLLWADGEELGSRIFKYVPGAFGRRRRDGGQGDAVGWFRSPN